MALELAKQEKETQQTSKHGTRNSKNSECRLITFEVKHLPTKIQFKAPLT